MVSRRLKKGLTQLVACWLCHWISHNLAPIGICSQRGGVQSLAASGSNNDLQTRKAPFPPRSNGGGPPASSNPNVYEVLKIKTPVFHNAGPFRNVDSLWNHFSYVWSNWSRSVEDEAYAEWRQESATVVGYMGYMMDRDRRLTGFLRGQTDNPEAPPGFELNNPWRLEDRVS